MAWQSLKREEVLKRLDTDIAAGLSDRQAAERLTEAGLNKLDEKPPRTFMQRFIDQMKDVMILILLAAAAVSLVIAVYHASTGQGADWIEPIVIVLIVLVNATLGAVQESRAEAALEALKKMTMPQVSVRRNGTTAVVSSEVLVPGDVLLLEAGDIVPADARLWESASLKSDESALTGESVPAEKDAEASVAEDAPLGDRVDMLYSGCAVSYGRGVAVVVETGMRTEMGKIAALLAEETETQTPLQARLAQLGKTLGILALGICAIIFLIGVLEKQPLMEMFMVAVSLAVAAIPEGLPAIVTVVLAIGVQRMVRRNAIVRRLPAVETLGSTTVICSDKTGTLTQNRMTLVRAYVGNEAVPLKKSGGSGQKEVRLLLELATLCTDGTVEVEDGEERHVGDPTETAIVAAALHRGILKVDLAASCPRLGEVPFDSDRKLMTTVNRVGDKIVAIVKGAPDALLACCTAGDPEAAARANEEMGAEALRVLALGVRELAAVPERFVAGELERDLTFVGLVGMIDPPRPEAAEAIAECDRAGIRTVMITGDHVVTASAIARQLGILHEGEAAMTGAELQSKSEEELASDIERYRVYARVSPSDKIRIVRAWQRKGAVVAMTGDGVNDAPALKAADIGCAMGITGTDVARGAADMVLTDDNFTTIVAAVREGRGIYDNIRKAIRFLLSCNLGEIVTVFTAMIVWRETPLLPIQLLWVNLVTDSLPALALGMEPLEPDVMLRRPRGKNESVFAGGMGAAAVWQGLMIGGLTLAAYAVGSRFLPDAGIALGETMAFAVLAFSQLVHAFNIRSRHPLSRVGFFSNKYMNRAFLASLALMLCVLCVPFLRGVFRAIPMNAREWAWVAGLSFLPLPIIQGCRHNRLTPEQL